MAKRSYPTSQVRGSDREELPTPEVGVAAERSYPVSEARGGSQECQAATAQEQPSGATPRLMSGPVAGRSYPTPKARGGDWKEKPHIQGAVASWAQGGLEELFHV